MYFCLTSAAALPRGARERRVAPRIGAVRHLHAASNAAVGVPVGNGRYIIPFAELHVNRLAAHQVTGTRHDVDRRQSARQCTPETGIPHIEGVQDPCFRLYGRGPVRAGRFTDMAVGVDEARHNDLP